MKNDNENPKDTSGYLPLQGKIQNVNNTDIVKNEVLKELIRAINLETDVDYTIEANRRRKRYGFLVSCTDADDDGKHINSLLMNFLDKFFPTFLKAGCFGIFLTPAVRLFKGNKIIRRFYKVQDFDEWCLTNSTSGLRVEYYKGLGSSTKDDIYDDLHRDSIIICIYDEEAHESLDMAFNTKRAKDRKVWIQNNRRVENVIYATKENFQSKTVTELINSDLVEYAVLSLSRALPHKYDGLKHSQRQILYYFLDKYDYGKKKSFVKISTAAGGIVEKTKYHHGDMCLKEAIIKLAQNYAGSNNLPLFSRKGRFGTRTGTVDGPGKNASDPRYLETSCESWLKFAFHKYLIELVDKVVVEGKPVEPFWIPCDIPLHVINGTRGIATAYACFIPSYDPLQIIDWLLEFLTTGEIPTSIKLKPYFRFYDGNIELIQYTKSYVKGKDNEVLKEDDIEDQEVITGLSFFINSTKSKIYV